ncbi:uncharacterized protein [Prorops nasuta]|uniref:uncharacterized protein n=1 Tax=Prorops nasuta TaxID=863751 RepID=UPI0034CECB59
MPVNGKTVLITGGANGIGYNYAEELLKNHAKSIAILDLATSNGENAVAKLEKEFGKGRAIFVVCDVTNPEQLNASIRRVTAEFKQLDILINNAGIMKDSEWELMLNINVNALIRSSLIGIDVMGKHKSGAGGTIVNIASVAGLIAGPIVPIYCASKTAVIGFSRSLAQSYDNHGVRILTMCPGITNTFLINDKSDRYLDFIDAKQARNFFSNSYSQPTSHVAKAMVDLIERGKNGAVVVSEDSEPLYEVQFTNYKDMKKPKQRCSRNFLTDKKNVESHVRKKFSLSVMVDKNSYETKAYYKYDLVYEMEKNPEIVIMEVIDKTALVTGGSTGIGFNIVKELLKNGAKAVAILDLSDSNGEIAVAELEKEFGENRAIFMAGDVSKKEEVEDIVKKVIDIFVTLDILINNAGIMNDADWEPMIDINFKGVVYCTLAALEHMSKTSGGQGGTILNVSAVTGLYANVLAPIYAGTTQAIVGFTLSLKHYHEKTGVRFLLICPGLTETGLASEFMASKERALNLLDDEMAELEMVKYQSQSPEHVAAAVVELLEKGQNGTVVVSENNLPPYAVDIPHYSDLMGYIKDKLALVTGGAGGLGFKYVEELLKNGAKKVAILDLPKSNGKAMEEKLQKKFGEGSAIFVPVDVTNVDRLKESFKEVYDAFGGLDIVINNAGILNEKNWELTININFVALVRSSYEFLELVGKHNGGKGGTLVNIASIVGLHPEVSVPIYSATKQAVRGFSKSLAVSATFEVTGVRVLVMCPGVTETDLFNGIFENRLSFMSKEFMQKQLSNYPRQNMDNVAKAMIDLIENQDNGSVVVSEAGEPPYVVEIPHYSTLSVIKK